MLIKMKTLCIDLRWIDSSGVGVYIKGIMPGLIESLGDVSIVGIGNRSRLEDFTWSRAANVHLVDCRAGRYSLAEQVQLPLAIPRNTDLFFSPYYTIPLLYRGRIAVTVHDLSHRLVPEITGNAKKRIYAKVMFREVRRRASIIFTVSNFSKLELLKFTTGPREDNILPTHLGISPEWSLAGESPSLRLRPYFIAVGNVKPYKNLGRLVDAFLQVAARIPHDLVIVGQSEGLITGESSEFFERVQRAGDRIMLTGPVTNGDLLSLVGHADALVMPSLYEGFGLPPLEAMAAGVPAVVSRAASLPEVCGDAALYFDPLDADDLSAKLLSIALDPSLRKILRAKGLERSSLFSWQKCAGITASGLRQALDAKNSAV
jgi:glycosyltransferase involved in cell wall biosynthesis